MKHLLVIWIIALIACLMYSKTYASDSFRDQYEDAIATASSDLAAAIANQDIESIPTIYKRLLDNSYKLGQYDGITYMLDKKHVEILCK